MVLGNKPPDLGKNESFGRRTDLRKELDVRAVVLEDLLSKVFKNMTNHLSLA